MMLFLLVESFICCSALGDMLAAQQQHSERDFQKGLILRRSPHRGRRIMSDDLSAHTVALLIEVDSLFSRVSW